METMNTDTPETDAAYKNHPWDMHDHIPLEFARRLERERDEARKKYDNLAAEHMLSVNKLCNERDEARKTAMELRDLVPWSESEPWNFSWENEKSPSVDATEMKS